MKVFGHQKRLLDRIRSGIFGTLACLVKFIFCFQDLNEFDISPDMRI